MPGNKIKEYLEKNSIDYLIIGHPTTFTAQRTAHSVHMSGKEFAKPVMLKVDGSLTMMVTTGNQRVNIKSLRKIFKTDSITLANESEFTNIFTDCEIGGIPPFGNIYDIDEYVTAELTKDKEIYFNAGSHNELIKMSYIDFERLVHPKVINFNT